jgi:tetratricopeptide (TPR) repeat protein
MQPLVGIRARAGRGGRALALAWGMALVCAGPARGEEAPLVPGSEAAPEAEPAAAGAASTAVVPPRVDPALEGLGAGLREWLLERLAEAGLEPAEPARVDAALRALAAAGRPVAHGADAPALAERTGAGRVLLSEFWFERGEVDLRIHLHAGEDARALAGAQAKGRVAELPQLAQGALLRMLDALGLETRKLAEDAAPRLVDLSAFGRARARLDANDLAGAWRELANATGPTAEHLRAQIDARAAAPGTTPAMRSRLANASGREDRDWLRVREGLRGPPNAETLLAAADAAVSRAEPGSAVRLYERVLELEPQSVAAHQGKAVALAEAGRAEESAAAWTRVSELVPADPGPHRELARFETLPPERRARHLFRAAELLAERFEAENARTSFEGAGQLDAGLQSAAHRSVGRLSERLGSTVEALIDYEQAAEVAPDDPEVQLGLGRMRAATEDRAGAAASFRSALEKSPDLAAAHAGLGETLAADGKDDEALPHLERAVALDPADTGARRALARARARRGDAQGAVAVLEAADLPAAVSPRERAGLLREAAQLRKEGGDLAGAERSLGTALALEPDDPPLRTALASVYEANGQAQRAKAELAVATSLGADRAAELEAGGGAAAAAVPAGGSGERGADSYATFDALAESFPTESPASRVPFGRVLLLGARESRSALGEVRHWLSPRRADLEAIDLAVLEAAVARFPVEETPEIPPDAAEAVEVLLAFSTDRETIAAVNQQLGSDAVFVARLSDDRDPKAPFWAAERPVLEVRLLGGRRSHDVFILANTLRLDELPGFRRWNWVAAGPWLLLLALLSYPVMRGWGTVVVRLDYDTKGARGFFHVKLSRRPGKAQTARQKEGQSAVKRWQGKARIWRRFARSMADPETRFRLVPARTWYVHVHGLLTDARTKDVIGNYVEERQVKVERGQLVKLAFDLRPKEAPIEVRLTKGEQPVQDSTVQAVTALRGRPETIRYLRSGSALIHVANGTHRVVVGCGDRVYEQEVRVHDLAGASVCFDLDRDEQALFVECPEAVEPYVNGDLPLAAQELDRAGQTRLANQLRGEYHQARGETEKAARYYEAAGRMQEAAELTADGDDTERSATLFKQAGDFGRAAERYRELGDHAQAGEAYEAAFDYDAAIDCHRQAGNTAKVVELLEKTGRYFEAGQSALESGDGDRAIHNLQLVDLRDPDHAEACRLLGQLFAERGDFELASQKIGEAISASGELDGAPLELLDQLGDLLQRAGHTERALETYETIRKRDYQFPGAAERVETLRELRQSEQQATAFATQQAPTAVGGGESRYEILAEIGRGGMGVVYQARDRRLGRVVALKRLPDNLHSNPTAVELFLREARAAAALNHPNIVTLFDADQEDGHYYLTMEFLDGFPLDHILKKRGRVTARDCVRLGVQIATGLHYAHERRIVHRDIKTANLFFTRERVVKIMDFGLAKILEEVRKTATVIGGTPYYMAPEQALGDNVDHRADLYAFGVTLFELLTGSVPFREGDVTFHHRRTPPPDPREAVPDLPDAFAELVLQLLEKEPAARPASAAEVGSRLAEIGSGLG